MVHQKRKNKNYSSIDIWCLKYKKLPKFDKNWLFWGFYHFSTIFRQQVNQTLKIWSWITTFYLVSKDLKQCDLTISIDPVSLKNALAVKGLNFLTIHHNPHETKFFKTINDTLFSKSNFTNPFILKKNLKKCKRRILYDKTDISADFSTTKKILKKFTVWLT